MRLTDINAFLRHQTTTGIQLRELDSFRGWACLGVLLVHCLKNTGSTSYFNSLPGVQKAFVWPFRHGWAGVDLFFVISGFLLFIRFGKAYYDGRPEPPKMSFYKRRLYRIAPAYYVHVLVMTALWYFVFSRFLWFRFESADLISHLLFLHNMSPTYIKSLSWVLWTLAIEAQYYLVLPFMANWFYGWRWLASAPLVLAACAMYKVAVMGIIDPDVARTNWVLVQMPLSQLAARIDQFVIGICFGNIWLYMLYRKKDAENFMSRRRATLLVLGGLTVLVTAFVLRDEFAGPYMRPWFFMGPMLAAGFGMLILGSLHTEMPFRALVANPAIEFLGIISFSVYLWHAALVAGLDIAWPESVEPGIANFIVRTAIVLPISLAMGTVSYVLFEKPFIRRSGQSKPPVKPVELREQAAVQ